MKSIMDNGWHMERNSSRVMLNVLNGLTQSFKKQEFLSILIIIFEGKL